MTGILIPEASDDQKPIFTLIDGRPTVSSLDIATHFEKRHERVLDVIRRILIDSEGLLREHNFVSTFRTVPGPKNSNRQEQFYHLSRDGFTLVVMGFTGKKALAWKIRYIEAFNQMERELLHMMRTEPPRRIAAKPPKLEVSLIRLHRAIAEVGEAQQEVYSTVIREAGGNRASWGSALEACLENMRRNDFMLAASADSVRSAAQAVQAIVRA